MWCGIRKETTCVFLKGQQFNSEAHEALRELKRLVDEAAEMTHAAELESFRAAINPDQDSSVRSSLQNVIERMKSPDFYNAVFVAREKLETALSI
jgi:hypothetical protein